MIRTVRAVALRGVTLLTIALLVCASARVAAADTPADPGAALADIRTQIDAVQASIRGSGPHSDDDLRAAGSKATESQARAAQIADDLAPGLGAIDARIAQLGTPAPGAVEDPNVARERLLLVKSRMSLDGQARLARLLALEAEQLAAEAREARRADFQARLSERTHSILSTSFWAELSADLPRDLQRLASLARVFGSAAGSTPVAVWVGALALLAVAATVLRWSHARVLGWLRSGPPPGRLRRSLHALLVIATAMLVTGITATVIAAAIDWRGTLPPEVRVFLGKCVVMGWFGGYMDGLGAALICARRPSWRLPALPDPVAARLRSYPLQITVVSLGAWLAEQLVAVVNASLAMTVAVDCVVALAMSLTLTLALMRAERSWRVDPGTGNTHVRPVWSKALAALNWLILVGAVISLLTGYVAIGSFTVKQVVWATIVIASAYLLAVLIDDVLTAWLADPRADAASGDKPSGKTLPPTHTHLAVLASGALRVVVVVIALVLIAAPFGQGPEDILTRRESWPDSISIGEFKLLPGSVLQAALVLVVGLVVVRLLRGWLAERYLPSTSMDADMTSSATALFGYAGIVLTIALAMSALGIGLERIAWVASALSVGIGFGLQAVVQNFVSGLIMLAERPVKVGDWVALGGVEGDIRRINVRATEIQMDDRSTLIVPNSEFITKVVRNRTLTNPFGVVVLKLPLPIDSDAAQVRSILLETLAADPEIFDSPAPSVTLDSVGDGVLVFNATGYVESPRRVSATRSALLFDALARLNRAGIKLSRPSVTIVDQPYSAGA